MADEAAAPSVNEDGSGFVACKVWYFNGQWNSWISAHRDLEWNIHEDGHVAFGLAVSGLIDIRRTRYIQ